MQFREFNKLLILNSNLNTHPKIQVHFQNFNKDNKINLESFKEPANFTLILPAREVNTTEISFQNLCYLHH